MANNNIFNRLFKAVKRAYSIPTLPDNILKIQSYPIIRILRFLGGISLLMILSKTYLNLNFYFLYICFFFSLIFTIYHFIISFYRIKHMVSVFKSDKFEIRNSPLDRFATLGARALWCLKGACETAQPVGVTLGLMISTDQILIAANKEPIFTPYLAGLLNKYFPGTEKESISKIIDKNLNLLNKNSVEIKEIDNTIAKVNEIAPMPGGLNEAESTELKQLLMQQRNELITNSDKIKETIINNLKQK